jgi:hypothetical protein
LAGKSVGALKVCVRECRVYNLTAFENSAAFRGSQTG